MNKLKTIATFAATLLTFGALQTALADDIALRAAATSIEPRSAELIVKVQRALSRYATACTAHDSQAIADSFTSFAVVEYATSAAGRFDAVDALATDKCWEGLTVLRDRSDGTPILAYSTNELNSVLIQYRVSIRTAFGQKSIQDLALVEIDGDRIARIRD